MNTREIATLIIEKLKNNLNLTDREKEDATQHISDLIHEEYKEALGLLDVSNLLPSKYYEIEFSNHVKAGIQINNNTPLVVGAVNGYGDGISSNDIKITEKQ